VSVGQFFWRDRTREVDFVVDAGGRHQSSLPAFPMDSKRSD
jgi:hypothetical protein